MDDLVQADDVFSDCVENPEDLSDIRKNLLDDFETAKTVSKILKDCSKLSAEREPVKVYLRVRPFTSKEIAAGESQGCLEIENMSSVLMHPPKTSFTFKHQTRNAPTAETIHRFTFSRVYGPNTSQKDFFEDTSLNVVKDFVDGQNVLMFSYGVTNAGKTYTILGNPQNVGILPRTINILFNSFKEQNYHRTNLKPRMYCDVQKLSSIQEEREESKKKMLLSLIDVPTYHNSVSSTDLSLQDISNAQCTHEDITDLSSVLDVTSVDVETQGPIQFSVWISFAEIYNEHIFDLLEPISIGNSSKPRKRNVLKVGDDRKGNPYVKGLTEIHVNNAEEALKLLKIGRKNQKIASTKLNETSSRSHCIFTLKILRVVNYKEPHVARVSRMSFVDLAGSERYTKTHNTGVRLKEAGNINTSIMTLGKCVELLRYNQHHTNSTKNIPFRESKLTRLLQGFFCGKGKASMVVNVNQCASAFDETLHALKFSAIAKKVTTQVQAPISIPVVPEGAPVRLSVAWADGSLSTPAGNKVSTAVDNNDDESVVAPLAEQEESIVSGPSNQELHALINVLQNQLIEEKKKLATMEIKIRQEVCQEMAEQMVEIENNYNERMLEDQRMNEELFEQRMDILTKSVNRTRKRPRVDRVEDDDDEWVSSVLLHQERVKVQGMTEKISELEEDLKGKTKELSREIEQFHKELANRDHEILSLKKASAGIEQETTEKTNDLLSEVENLRKELACRDKENESLKKVCDAEQQLQEEKKCLLSEFEALRKELACRDKENESLKKVCDAEQQLQEEKKCLLSEVENLRKELACRDKENESSKKVCAAEPQLQKEKKCLLSEVENLRKELACRDKENESSKKVCDAEQQLQEEKKCLLSEVENLRKELACRDKENESLKKVSITEQQLEEEKKSFMSEVENLRKELACRDKENESLKKVSINEQQLQEEKKSLLSDVETLRKVLACRDKENESLKKVSITEQQLQEEKKSLLSDVETLRKVLACRDKENESLKKVSITEQQLQEEKKSLLSDVEALRKELACRDEENESLKKVSITEQQLQEEKKNLLGEVDNLRKELACRDKESESLKKVSCTEQQLQEEKKNLLGEVDNLRKELACRDKENESLKVRVKDCKIELETKTTQLMAVKKVQGGRVVTPTKTGMSNNLVKKLEKRLEETTAALDKKNTQLISKNNCIAKLEESLKEAKKDLDDQIQELAELKATKESLKERVDEEEVSRRIETNGRVKELETLLAAKSNENEEVMGNLKFVEGELEILGSNEKEKEKELMDLKEERENLVKEVNEWKEQVAKSTEWKENAEKEMEEKEAVYKKIKTELEDVKVSNESKERELQRREIKINSLAETIEGLSKELAHTKDNYKGLQETNDKALSDLVDVQATVDVRNQELEQFENLSKSQKDAYRGMETGLMNAKRDLENAKNVLKSKEKEMNQLKDEMEIRMNQEILKVKEDYESTIERMRLGLAEQDEVLSGMEKEIIRKENEMTELQEAVEKLNEVLQDRDEKVQKLGHENESLDDQSERLKIKVFELETEVEKLQQELKKEKSKKDTKLTQALKEGLEMAKAKKAEYEEKKNNVMKESEEERKGYEQKIKDLEEKLCVVKSSGESEEKSTSEKDSEPSDEDVYKPVEVESFNLPGRSDRVEIDVTPITGSGLGKSSKKTTSLKHAGLKRNSSELTLKEIKDIQEKRKKANNVESEDDFTPVSVTKLRKARSSSVHGRSRNTKASIAASPSSFSLSAFDENSENTCPLTSRNSHKSLVSGKRGFFSKLGIHESGKSKPDKLPPTTTLNKKRRKLLKKNEISAPLTDSPLPQSDKLETPKTSSKAQEMITRHLRSRVIKSSR